MDMGFNQHWHCFICRPESLLKVLSFVSFHPLNFNIYIFILKISRNRVSLLSTILQWSSYSYHQVLLSLALLGVSTGKPFAESHYGQLLRNLHRRSAQLGSYGGSQAAAPVSEYGSASAPACRTEYKQECNTVNEQECNTVNEQQVGLT